MKKVITTSLLFIFVLAGCAGQNGDKQDESDKTLREHRMPDFERPEERPSISGIVKTIIGNEITVLKIEMPANFNEMNSENKGSEEGENTENENNREQRPITGFSGGMGGHGMSMGGRSSMGTTDSDERLAMLKSLSTGEEKIIIPVGIKMLKNEDGEMVEATLTDVARDKMLMIWTDKTITDRNIANFVIIN